MLSNPGVVFFVVLVVVVVLFAAGAFVLVVVVVTFSAGAFVVVWTVVVVVVALLPSMVTGLYTKNLRVSLSAVWMLIPGISTTSLFLLRVTALSLLSMVMVPAVASTVLMVYFSY